MTTPYVTGTVSVTAGSAIVTGVGTGWLTSGLVAGQFGLDSANGNPVPVLSIDSDTQITLAKQWRGASASAQGYWITYDVTPGQQTVANAQMLALYLSRLDKPALAALASLVPTAEKLPYFGANGAGALTDFNAAARALLAGGVLPNGQLPARLRSTIPGSVIDVNTLTETGYHFALGGSTNTPGAGNWYIQTIAQGVGVGNASGVRQRAYTDNGHAVYERYIWYNGWQPWRRADPPERGSNANGEYVRFADGTQICRGNFVGYTANVGILKTSPASFISAVNPCFASVTPYGSFDFNYSCFSDGNQNFNFISTSSSPNNRVDWVIIGRWY
ncbi:phage tail protein [Agrobacterium rosae]|uniref:Phage tail protein n=1 Tax=Agrobacterium rosae TaxID=1972867 RepID=A0AAE5VRN7_9HYPH|nr:pyocin knob domain-containing protein [Agrobacterium rosae]POO54405.1 phage tail protein [Agrobacterium rosae]